MGKFRGESMKVCTVKDWEIENKELVLFKKLLGE